MSRRRAARLEVASGGHQFAVSAGRKFRFGRDPSCDLVIGADDLGVSRRAGAFAHDGGAWRLVNLSAKRSLHVVERGFGYPVFPAAPDVPNDWELRDQHATVLVPGETYTYSIDVYQSNPVAVGAPDSGSDVLDERSTLIDVDLTRVEHRALVGLCARYLSPIGSYEPRMNTYEEAAELLGVSKKTVEHQFAEVRRKISTRVFLPPDPTQARESACRYMLANRLVRPNISSSCA